MANPIPASDAVKAFRRPVSFAHAEGANVETLSGTKTLTVLMEQFQRLNPNGSNRNVVLPAPDTARLRGHFYLVFNAGSSGNLVVTTSAPTTLATLTPGQAALVVHTDANYVLVAQFHGAASSAIPDFGAGGIKTDVIAESTSAAGVTVDSMLIKDGGFVLAGTGDLNGLELILDADADTSITADTDDQIDVKISGADDFLFVANIFRALSGSVLETNTINETTAASGVTIDSTLVKDGGVRIADSGVHAYGADSDVAYTHNGTDSVRVTNAASGTVGYDDDVLNVCDPADPTKRARLDAGDVTAGQTRVISAPDANVSSEAWLLRASGTISAAALRTLNATPVEMIPAPAAGKYIKVHWIHWFLDYGGVAMDAAAAGDTLEAKYTNGSGAAVVDAVAGNAIGAASADYHTTVMAVPEVIPVTAAAIVAHINTGEWYAAAGTSELKWVAYYQVVTLPT